MTHPQTRSVVVEQDMPHPPEKVWRALTQPHLIEDWLMSNDFEPVVGRPFRLQTSFGHIDCRVLTVEPPETLAYSWDALGLESTVTWTITPTATGVRLRMEQAGFRPDQDHARRGATAGWHRFLGKLQDVLARPD